MAETQSTTTTTTEATAPTGDIKVFIDAFNKDFDAQLKSLLDAQQNYKNVYADAIKISTPKKGRWPLGGSTLVDGNTGAVDTSQLGSDPKIVTIGDLFKYTFPDINSDKIIKPDKYSKEYGGWAKDLKDSEDEKIRTMYDTISDGISSNKQIESYQNLKKPGITNPSLWSPGQYYFDVFMSQMLSPYGPLKDPSGANAGEGAFGGNIIEGGWEKGWLKANGGSASVSNFSTDGVGATGSFGYDAFYEILNGGYVGSGIKYKMKSLTDIDIHLDDVDTKPPKSFSSLLTQYRTGLLNDFITVENGKIIPKDSSFNIYEGIITDPLDKEVEISQVKALTDITGYKFVGYYEHMPLYKAFIQAGDNYKPVVLPLRNPEPTPEPEVNTKPIVNLPEVVGYTFNVEKKDSFVIVGGSMSGMEFTIVPNDGTTYITNEAPISNVNDEDMLGDEYLESGYQGQEESLLELAAQIKIVENLQAELEPGTTGSTFTVNDANISDGKYVGAVWKSFDIEAAVTKIKSTSFKPSDKFRESLKQVLYYIKNDPDINDIREGAYILGTAYAESGYSLQRWEADYACSGQGIPYGPGGPCSSATSYYRSTKGGKRNYYELGTDSKGQCFFGRGLIQLTGKGNYEKYGGLIGVNLLGNGDLALSPQNSYKVASTYMRGRTFKHVLNNDLTRARKSVNGGTKGIAEVNGAYSAWLNVLKSLSTTVA